jgi:peptidyl-prolyl cis-trans isomerase SurA
MMFVLIIILSTLSDQVAAFVGDDVILESEVRENMSFLANDPVAQQMFNDTDELRDYVLDELISQRLILIEAKNESISVAEDQVLQIVEQRIEEIKERYPSEADFLKDLEENNITLQDLKQYNEENIRTQMITQRLVERKIATKITISPITVRRFYEENKDSIAVRPVRVKLSHMLMAIRPSEAELRRGFDRAMDVYKLLYGGADFSVMVEEFSEDENSRHRAGMLGKIKRGETIEEFEEVIFNLKPGSVSQPFPTRLGYHLVEVLNKGSDWVLARQILIKVNVAKADTVRYENLARKLAELVNSGADFDSLAREYSDDPAIDLGEFILNQLSPPIDEVVKNLEQGQVSEPFITPYGYHIIYLKEKIAEEPLTFEELRDQIYQYLTQQELQKYFTQLIEELKEKTFVKKFESRF